MVRGNREEEILEAAIKIFSEKGFSAATTSEIAKEAGVAEGTIFRYFKTKKDILIKVMAKVVEILGEKLIIERLTKLLEENKEKSEREILITIVKDRLEMFEKYWDMIKIVATEMQFHKDLREVFIKSVVTKGKDIVENFINAGVSKGVFRKVDTAIALRSLIGMVGIYVIQSQVFPEVINMDKDRQIEEMVDLFLYGLSKKN
ncbi:TetR/AcrR family transcriptional regulator [Clostridium omnivorum]|uniref:AcrR family transcriptional regulator n=1 Tax=Clostridium omnivorum TaxID=1604902 RepID=A0ABQ5N340_9CLOT|nr:TetR/AcrR family transcriptional regulator [Clostridium sp. E14]GLC29625.1 AcrR family transcriptional regulator [Clostridium sp. E14]